MDEKTEELRDIFVDVTDEESVTERQAEGPGSLAGDDGVDAELGAIVSRMRERYGFRTDLPDADYRRIVRGFFGEEGDGEIADDLDCPRRTVVLARLDLHLLREADLDPPADPEAIAAAATDGAAVEGVAAEVGAPEPAVRRYLAAAEAHRAAEAVSGRFRREFEETLPETAISTRHAAAVREDGLAEATEGMENDLQL